MILLIFGKGNFYDHEHKTYQNDRNRIKKKISVILHRFIKDPRLFNIMVTVYDVKITNDLSYAKVFVTFFNIRENQKEKIKKYVNILRKTDKYIRFLISKTTNLKSIPELRFIYDHTFYKSNALYELMKNNIK